MRAVLFDLDDTLVDQSSAARSASISWGRTHGLVGSGDELAHRWSALSTPHYDRYQRREVSFAQQRRARVREFLPHLELADDGDADAAFRGYLDLYEAAWVCFADAVPALRRVREAGLVAAVLTNGNHEHQQLKLRLVGLHDEIDALFTSDEFVRGKPDPAPFLGSCSRLGVEPAEVVMVGDSRVNDIDGALGAGLDAVLLDRRDEYTGSDVRRISTLDDLEF